MEITENELISLQLVNKDHAIKIDTDAQVEKIAKALSSITRRRILKEIKHEGRDVSNIAKLLKMTEANISAQIKFLEAAGLITCNYRSGQHGVRKISNIKYNKIILKF